MVVHSSDARTAACIFLLYDDLDILQSRSRRFFGRSTWVSNELRRICAWLYRVCTGWRPRKRSRTGNSGCHRRRRRSTWARCLSRCAFAPQLLRATMCIFEPNIAYQLLLSGLSGQKRCNFSSKDARRPQFWTFSCRNLIRKPTLKPVLLTLTWNFEGEKRRIKDPL